MTSSSPASSLALHQDAHAQSDEDKWPKPPNPVEIQGAELVQQEQHAQADKNQRANRHTRMPLRRQQRVGTAHRSAGINLVARSRRERIAPDVGTAEHIVQTK